MDSNTALVTMELVPSSSPKARAVGMDPRPQGSVSPKSGGGLPAPPLPLEGLPPWGCFSPRLPDTQSEGV